MKVKNGEKMKVTYNMCFMYNNYDIIKSHKVLNEFDSNMYDMLCACMTLLFDRKTDNDDINVNTPIDTKNIDICNLFIDSIYTDYINHHERVNSKVESLMFDLMSFISVLIYG